ncbi:unnamed protein product [Clavelina lepadiformis]|uniref:Uncharacterized protein n=1 Tax=Clavelina lepadiformis TaxID=159417 RepID=A0ABP0H1V6_CLALP
MLMFGGYGIAPTRDITLSGFRTARNNPKAGTCAIPCGCVITMEPMMFNAHVRIQ